jgi:hypothetical protein
MKKREILSSHEKRTVWWKAAIIGQTAIGDDAGRDILTGAAEAGAGLMAAR